MIERAKALAVGVLALALLVASTAGASAAKASKPALDLKVPKGGSVPDGTIVKAGMYVSFGNYYCQEGAGSMTLVKNDATKDTATGTVKASAECKEEEIAAAAPTPRRSAGASGRARRDGAIGPAAAGASITGSLGEQELTSAHAGAMKFSKALTLSLGVAPNVCVYAAKKRIAGVWPPELNPEFPEIQKTANLWANATLKLSKRGSAKTCAKTAEAYVEVWLGPSTEELEAELVG